MRHLLATAHGLPCLYHGPVPTLYPLPVPFSPSSQPLPHPILPPVCALSISSAAAAYGPVITHIANGIVLLGILGLVVSVILGLARACGAATFLWMPDPWCPAAMCIDCQGGGLPVCMELGAGECGMAMMAFLGVLVILLGVVASAVLTWHLLLLGAQIALSKAQHMVGVWWVVLDGLSWMD